ncbi:MAG TPA: DUF1127 domain-containing protein [Alphaproteobacteria bacterium]|jgi:uncharacterized protein YjiS (DUF1127 family)
MIPRNRSAPSHSRHGASPLIPARRAERRTFAAIGLDPPMPSGSGLARAVSAFALWCMRCHARAEQRRHLAELDERMLKDVGITPAEAAEESTKPWWRA